MRKQNNKGILVEAFYFIIIFFTCVIITVTFYLFYFTSCEEVKANWLIVETPARCIK